MKKKLPLLVLAPMAGITDLPFRLICKEFGADLLYSEMVSATGLIKNPKKNHDFAESYQQDTPLILQLFGSNPKDFAQATQIIDSLPDRKTNESALGRPDGLDINFGCPVKKVLKQGAGVALMKKPKLARKIIRAVLENTTLPVSIKIRAGIEKMGAIDFLDQIADLKWSTVIVHGRTFKQGFSGPIDFGLIKEIKKLYPEKKVIANGRILTPEDALETLEKTGADGLAIARGCLGRPWLFRQIKDYLQAGSYQSPTLAETKKIALKHARLMQKYKGERSIIEFRKHLGWYFKGLPSSKELRKRLFDLNDWQKLKKMIERI